MNIFTTIFILIIGLIGLMIGLIIDFSTADIRMERIEEDMLCILKLLCNSDAKESDSEDTKEPNTDGKV